MYARYFGRRLVLYVFFVTSVSHGKSCSLATNKRILPLTFDSFFLTFVQQGKGFLEVRADILLPIEHVRSNVE